MEDVFLFYTWVQLGKGCSAVAALLIVIMVLCIFLYVVRAQGRHYAEGTIAAAKKHSMVTGCLAFVFLFAAASAPNRDDLKLYILYKLGKTGVEQLEELGVTGALKRYIGELTEPSKKEEPSR